MDPPSPRVELAKRLFGGLAAGGIAFCVVGDLREFPARIPSDLDIVIDAADAAKLPRLLYDVAMQNGATLVQVIRYERQAWCFILAGFGQDGRPWFLHPDFSCGYCEGGRPLLDATELLAERRPGRGSGNEAIGIVTAAPEPEFIYYLMKKIEKQALNERQAGHLTAMYREGPEGAVAQLRRFWSGADVELIARAATGGDWSDFCRALPRLQAALHRARPIPWLARLHEAMRIVDRILHPTGLWVAFLGPDGSGKSTILSRVADEIAPAFQRTQLFHLRAPLLRQHGSVRPHDNPHGQRARGCAASLVQLAVNLVRCWLGYWLHLWPARARSTFIGFDRYYPDLLVDPRRYRYGGPHWLARLVCTGIPQPDLWILLDAPASVITARKKEIPPAEIERQRLSYRQLVVGMRNGHIIDASRSPDEVVHRVEQIIIEFLADRTARRLALGPP
jgi:thymidylate kinase